MTYCVHAASRARVRFSLGGGPTPFFSPPPPSSAAAPPSSAATLPRLLPPRTGCSWVWWRVHAASPCAPRPPYRLAAASCGRPPRHTVAPVATHLLPLGEEPVLPISLELLKCTECARAQAGGGRRPVLRSCFLDHPIPVWLGPLLPRWHRPMAARQRCHAAVARPSSGRPPECARASSRSRRAASCLLSAAVAAQSPQTPPRGAGPTRRPAAR
jgi:hypothetical protein